MVVVVLFGWFYFLRIFLSAYSVVCHSQHASLWTSTVLVFVNSFCLLVRLHLCWKWLDSWCDWQYLKLVEAFAFLFRIFKTTFDSFMWQLPTTSFGIPWQHHWIVLVWNRAASTVQLCILPSQKFFQQVLLLNTSTWVSSFYPFCRRASLDDVFWGGPQRYLD